MYSSPVTEYLCFLPPPVAGQQAVRGGLRRSGVVWGGLVWSGHAGVPSSCYLQLPSNGLTPEVIRLLAVRAAVGVVAAPLLDPDFLLSRSGCNVYSPAGEHWATAARRSDKTEKRGAASFTAAFMCESV